MGLVAAAALGMALARAAYSLSTRSEPRGYLRWCLAGPPTCFAAALALAVVVLQAIPPRPRWRGLVRQSGWVASAATVAGVSLALLGATGFEAAVASNMGPANFRFDTVWMSAMEVVPAFVLGAWVGLRLSGGGRSATGALDRLGRLVGWFWMAELARKWAGSAIESLLTHLGL